MPDAVADRTAIWGSGIPQSWSIITRTSPVRIPAFIPRQEWTSHSEPDRAACLRKVGRFNLANPKCNRFIRQLRKKAGLVGEAIDCAKPHGSIGAFERRLHSDCEPLRLSETAIQHYLPPSETLRFGDV